MKKTLAFLILFLSLSSIDGFAYEVGTHEAINRFVTDNSASINTTLQGYGLANGLDTYIPLNGNTKISAYIREGGRLEDELTPLRPMNHFHNPLKTWDISGYSNLSLIDVSNPVWAQEAGVNSLWAQETGALTGNFYSWPSAREYLYDALTATDENTRNYRFIACFHSLGQVMHLMEDLAVPAHTRNDSHIAGNIYEEWVDYVRQNWPSIFNGYLSNYTYTPDSSLFTTGTEYNPYAVIPIAGLFDADVYTGKNPNVTAGAVGLSEYTNANFFSENTIEKNFAFPNHTTFVDITTVVFQNPIAGGTVTRPYYKKMPGAGDSGYYLATVDALKYYVKNIIQVLHNNSYYGIFNRKFRNEINQEMGEAEQLDDYCYRDYASRLLPRAAGYSKALLQYFFRGQIDAVEASATTDTSGNISGITLKVKNNTPGENITQNSANSSHFVVSYSYQDSAGNSYYGCSAPVNLNGNIFPGNDTSTDTYKYTFSFSNSIPSDATHIQYMLVYRGQLGQETDAVAAKTFKPSLIIEDWENDGLLWSSTNNCMNISLADVSTLGSKSMEIDIPSGESAERVIYNEPMQPDNFGEWIGAIQWINYAVPAIGIGDFTANNSDTLSSAGIYLETKAWWYFKSDETVDIQAELYYDDGTLPGELIAKSETKTLYGSDYQDLAPHYTELKFPQGVKMDKKGYYSLVFRLSNFVWDNSPVESGYFGLWYSHSYDTSNNILWLEDWIYNGHEYWWAGYSIYSSARLSAKVTASGSSVSRTFATPFDCSKYTKFKITAKSDVAGNVLNFIYGTDKDHTVTVPITLSNGWQGVEVPISNSVDTSQLTYFAFELGPDGIDSTTGLSLQNTIFIDQIEAE